MEDKYLTATEEQTAYISLGDRVFELRIYPFRSLMYCDITDGDGYVCAGKRIICNEWLLPDYEAKGVGNFRFETYIPDVEDYPWWEDFGKKFALRVYTADELDESE